MSGSRRVIDLEHLQPMALGCSVLGAGGGGDTYATMLACRHAIERFGPVELADLDDLPDEALVMPCGYIGAPVVSLLPPGNVKVRFFVPETKLGAVAVGQKVTLACDGCGSIAGTIVFIATQAEYTPPVIYSKDNRTKLVFLVEAKPAPEDAMKLHPGQPVDVTLP